MRVLCTLAQADESTLSFPLPDNIFGFHAQQACEKWLKALVASCHQPYPFTHKLDELTDLLTSLNEAMPSTPYPITDLTRFAVSFRYDIGPPIPLTERDAIRETVAMLRQHILTRILATESVARTTGN